MSRIPRPILVALLVGLAAVAVVRNVVFFTDYGRGGGDGADDAATSAALAPKPLPQSRPRAAAAIPTALPERRIAALRAASTPYPGDLSTVRDPFHLPRPAVRRPAQKSSPRQPSPAVPQLQVVLTSGRRQVAMVESEIVAPGDVVRGMRVAEISSGGVRLTEGGKETQVELPPLQTDLASDDLR